MYLSKANKARLSEFYRRHERHLFGIDAGEEVAKMYAHDAGIGDIAQNHSLTRLAKHYCKYWRMFQLAKHKRRSRNNMLSASEWKDLMRVIDSISKNFDGTETIAFVHRRARSIFSKAISIQVVREGLKVCGHLVKEKP